MQPREALQRAGYPVDPGVLQALPELAALELEVFHHDDTLTVLGIPIGVIALGRWYAQRITNVMVKAGFEFGDVDVMEVARPVALQAHLSRDAGVAADLVEIEREAHLGCVRIDELHDLHVLDDQSGIAILQ